MALIIRQHDEEKGRSKDGRTVAEERERKRKMSFPFLPRLFRRSCSTTSARRAGGVGEGGRRSDEFNIDEHRSFARSFLSTCAVEEQGEENERSC